MDIIRLRFKGEDLPATERYYYLTKEEVRAYKKNPEKWAAEAEKRFGKKFHTAK